MIIKIDKSAGFCRGVQTTIDTTEKLLELNPQKQIHVLGEIIHNPLEIHRLKGIGLDTADIEDLTDFSNNPQEHLLIIRAHGEPPTTYQRAKELNIELVDATCPKVTSLQNKVKTYSSRDYQIIIFGKPTHPEVIGLRGVCNDNCDVITSEEDANSIKFHKDNIILISQTTMNQSQLFQINEIISSRINKENTGINYIFQDTTCRSVVNRESSLINFAKDCDIVLFVSGKNSSNGKSLYQTAKSANNYTYFIEDIVEIEKEWLNNVTVVGISGATSTPRWYLEFVRKAVMEMV